VADRRDRRVMVLRVFSSIGAPVAHVTAARVQVTASGDHSTQIAALGPHVGPRALGRAALSLIDRRSAGSRLFSASSCPSS